MPSQIYLHWIFEDSVTTASVIFALEFEHVDAADFLFLFLYNFFKNSTRFLLIFPHAQILSPIVDWDILHQWAAEENQKAL